MRFLSLAWWGLVEWKKSGSGKFGVKRPNRSNSHGPEFTFYWRCRTIAPRFTAQYTQTHVFIARSRSRSSSATSSWAFTCMRGRKVINDTMLLLPLRALLVTVVWSLEISCAASTATTPPHTWGPQSFWDENSNKGSDSRGRRSRNSGRVADSSSSSNSNSSRQQSTPLLLPGGALRARGGSVRAALKKQMPKREQKGVNRRALPAPEALSRYE